MSYRFDQYDQALVIEGWEKGIADNPFDGIADMRNCNVISIPGEVSVNFATSKISSPTITGNQTVTGLSANAISFLGITGLEDGMAITFSSVGSLTGVSTNTTYWVYSCSGSPVTSCKLYATFSAPGTHTGAVTIGGSAGGATFRVYNVGYNGSTSQNPTYFAYDKSSSAYYMQDGLGQVWTNAIVTLNNSYWMYTGDSGTSDTNSGCGLVYYQSTTDSSKRYIFAFNSQSIDFLNLNTGTWTWGWKPLDGTTHNSGYLKANGNHQTFAAPDNRVYYCDGRYVGSFYETTPTSPFNPTDTSTYTQASNALLPSTDTAKSLAFLGGNLLIGGQNNLIYPWDRVSTNFNLPIILPEYNTVQMITVNTNTYIFVGNRGRIYTTNGTNAQLFKKVPDHISGTVEPYFTWGGVCTTKNQLYFSCLVKTNSGSDINQYGGVWAIDMETEALRLTNKLSYGTYAGYASALIPNFSTNPAGTGLYIGWSDNSGTNYGIDQTTSSPYTGSQATIDSDLIPIGTYNKTKDMTRIEYKLVRPLVNGESITVKTRLIFNTTDTGYTTALSDSTVGNYSSDSPVNFQQAQWVQFQIVLNSTASSPSYTRLKHIRILGLTGASAAQTPVLDIGN